MEFPGELLFVGAFFFVSFLDFRCLVWGGCWFFLCVYILCGMMICSAAR